MTLGFRPMLGLRYVAPRELVVVERPWLDLKMPPSFFRGGRYGT